MEGTLKASKSLKGTTFTFQGKHHFQYPLMSVFSLASTRVFFIIQWPNKRSKRSFETTVWSSQTTWVHFWNPPWASPKKGARNTWTTNSKSGFESPRLFHHEPPFSPTKGKVYEPHPRVTLTLLGTNISTEKSILKMIFLFPRWDMLISWRVSSH